MNIEAVILRRCYPVPVTFADLRTAYQSNLAYITVRADGNWRLAVRLWWQQSLKETTGALDEVYAVVDGREVRVGTVNMADKMITLRDGSNIDRALDDLLDAADRAGYWERPHEVRLDLEERAVSHDSVARAVMVGQEYVERHGAVRS